MREKLADSCFIRRDVVGQTGGVFKHNKGSSESPKQANKLPSGVQPRTSAALCHSGLSPVSKAQRPSRPGRAVSVIKATMGKAVRWWAIFFVKYTSSQQDWWALLVINNLCTNWKFKVITLLSPGGEAAGGSNSQAKSKVEKIKPDVRKANLLK